MAREGEVAAPRGGYGSGKQAHAVFNKPLIRRLHAVPFEHGEFWMMEFSSLPVSEHVAQMKDALFSSREEFLGRKFRRRVQIKRQSDAAFINKFGVERADVGLISRRDLQSGGIDFEKGLG
jgi:hypothetical protein